MSRLLDKQVKRYLSTSVTKSKRNRHVTDFKVSDVHNHLQSAQIAFDKNKRPDVLLKAFPEQGRIQVFMLKKRRFFPFPIGFRKRFLVGCIPAGITNYLYDNNLHKKVKAKTRSIYLHADKTMTITIDLIILSDKSLPANLT